MVLRHENSVGSGPAQDERVLRDAASPAFAGAGSGSGPAQDERLGAHSVEADGPPSLEASADKPNRIIKLERTSSARRRIYVPVLRRAERFLAALAESGNASLACEVAGIGKDRIYRLRREDEAFAARWQSALDAFRARIEAADSIDLEAIEKDGMTIRRGRGGQLQVCAAHPLAWTGAREDLFFESYAETGNVSASARAAGFSAKAAWERARACPAFAERLAKARDEATERLHFQLIETGSNLLKGADGAKPDPQLAMWLLKREDQKQAGTLKHGAARARPWSFEESIGLLDRKLRALGGRQERERLEQGWSRSPDGHWIPPGYGPSESGEADGAAEPCAATRILSGDTNIAEEP
jgi:molybdenum-dependent DNA-binding transcriptional regulator ModE